MTADPTAKGLSIDRAGKPPAPTDETGREVLPGPAARAVPSWVEADVAFLCRLGVHDETAWRLEAETRIQAQSGWRTAFVPLDAPPDGSDRPVPVDALPAACLRDGAAFVADPRRMMVRTRLLVLHRAERLFDALLAGGTEAVPRVLADRAVAVVSEAGGDGTPLRDAARRDALLKSLFGPSLTWAATDATAAQALRDAFPGLAVEPEPWLPSTWAEPAGAGRPERRQPVVGCIRTDPAAGPPPGLPAFPDASCRVLAAPGAPAPAGWERIGTEEMDPVKFVSSLDFLVHFQDGPHRPGATPGLPVHAIARALVLGIPTVLPPSFSPLFGPGPLYLDAAEAWGAIRRLHADPAACRRASLATARHGRASVGPEVHRARLARLTGLAPGPLRGIAPGPLRGIAPGPLRGIAPGSRPGGRAQARPVLFVSANEVGLGHLTRLLAVARRCPDTVAPVFACLGQGVRIVEQAGFPAEFIPTPVQAGCDAVDWNGWLYHRIGDILDSLDAGAVVLDGSTLFDGLVRAVGRRRGCRLVWLRRAMWRADQANRPLLARQRFCDLVIEPGDLAQALDGGITVAWRHVAREVPPIRLLDPEEMPDREAAAARLGLDPARPAALIQLGAGTNRDVVGMIDAVLAALAGHPEVQPVIADWAVAPAAPDLWPGVKRLRGFPFGRWLNAFDFAFSAAGYNSFHEIMDAGLPAVFLPNIHPAMDDQAGRAAHAQAQGCAFHLEEADETALATLATALMEPKVRRLMRDNCRRLVRPNGAGQAAAAIAALVS